MRSWRVRVHRGVDASKPGGALQCQWSSASAPVPSAGAACQSAQRTAVL